MSLEREITRVHEDIWTAVPDGAWLNVPRRIHEAQSRARQLALAHKHGLATPTTIVTNSWSEVLRGTDAKELVIKSLSGTLVAQNETRALYTTRVSRSDAARWVGKTTPHPSLIQPFIAKRREWRVTVVERSVFPVAIYTSGAARDDWREYQFTDAVSFRRDELPTAVSKACLSLIEECGLAFGALDLIETPTGEFVFLELNPNGQYAWLDDQLGLGISTAIANALLKRAAGQRDGRG